MNAIQPPPEWEPIDFAVDSGASETVMSEGLVRSVEVTPSAASLRGVKYEVANGEHIPNLGEKHLRGFTDQEGFPRHVTAQVCDVSKPLMSVAKLVKTGNTVVFTGNVDRHPAGYWTSAAGAESQATNHPAENNTH